MVFIVRFPVFEKVGIAPNTDAGGETQQSFPVTDAEPLSPGTVVAVDVWGIYSDLGVGATVSFVIR